MPAGIRRTDIDEYGQQAWTEIEYIRELIARHVDRTVALARDQVLTMLHN